MNPKPLVLFLALALMAGGLFATDSRMTALGYPYGVIRDDTDIHFFPGTIFKYNRGIYGELYSNGDDWDWSLGANVPMKTNVFGLYLHLPSEIDMDEHLNYNSNLELYHKVQAYYGFAEKFALGLAFGFDSATEDYDSGSSKTRFVEKQQGQFVELKFGMSEEKLDLGAKVLYQGAKINEKIDNTSTDVASYSGFGVDLGGRYFIQEDSMLDLAIFGDLGYEALTDEYEPTGVKSTLKLAHSDINAAVGIGANYKLAPGHSIIMTFKPIGVYSANVKDTNNFNNNVFKNTQTYLTLPEYTLGVESRITKWLTGRVGARQNFGIWTWKDEAELESNVNLHDIWSEYEADFDMNLGLAIKLGKFTIDTVFSKNFLHDGPAVIGGSTKGLNSQVSLKFEY